LVVVWPLGQVVATLPLQPAWHVGLHVLPFAHEKFGLHRLFAQQLCPFAPHALHAPFWQI
jgi:hypothetical protein